VNGVLGVALETRVNYPLNFLVALEQLGNSQGVGLGTHHTDLESLGATEGDPGVEGAETSSHGLKVEEEFVVEFAAVQHDGSGDHIRVTTNVLGNRVRDHVGTEVEGVSVDGGREGVVNAEEDTCSLKGVGDLSYVKALKGRVSGGLEPAKLCVFLDLLLELGDVAEVGESHLNVCVGVQDLVKVALSATVNIVNAENMVTVLKQ
jgi:hypothetical protein